MHDTPKLLEFVRERLHEQPQPIYPTLPFSKRQAASAARATEAFQVARSSNLQLTAARTVYRNATALPLIQMIQLQSSQFQSSFSASAYRSRFSLLGGGGRFV